MTSRALTIEPRGLSRSEAAAYVGIGTTLFDQLVHKRLLPQGARLEGRLIWDRRALDAAMDRIFDAVPAAPGNDDKWGVVRA